MAMKTDAMPGAMSSTPELDLVTRHRYGDPRAFEEVFARFSPMVFNIALRLSGDSQDAADLSQEVFLRVHRHLGRFGGRSSLKTWIYRVAVNHCRSRLGRKRLPCRPLAAVSQDREREVPDPRRGPEELAVAGDLARLVEEALAALPLRFREAVVLRDLEGLSYQEIAAVLRVRIGTVRSRIARGRARLRSLLEDVL
jgi:RNA polymerase sigma-70 factor (ECF subfamily)